MYIFLKGFFRNSTFSLASTYFQFRKVIYRDYSNIRFTVSVKPGIFSRKVAHRVSLHERRFNVSIKGGK